MKPDLMTITPEFFLAFTKYCVNGIAVSMAALTILGGISVRTVGVGAVKPMLQLIAQGDALRMMTVIFIVSATTGLVVLGRIDGTHAATIFSGVSGYVLGSGARRRDRNPATGQQTATGTS
jgi:hypothetical protein